MRAAALVVLALSVTGCRERAQPTADVVAANNRGVGLMGQFDFAQARTIFADLVAAHPRSRRSPGQPRGRDAQPAAGGGRSGCPADPAARAVRRSAELRAHDSLGLLRLNDGQAVGEVRIRWPDGSAQDVDHVAVDSTTRVIQPR